MKFYKRTTNSTGKILTGNEIIDTHGGWPTNKEKSMQEKLRQAQMASMT